MDLNDYDAALYWKILCGYNVLIVLIRHRVSWLVSKGPLRGTYNILLISSFTRASRAPQSPFRGSLKP